MRKRFSDAVGIALAIVCIAGVGNIFGVILVVLAIIAITLQSNNEEGKTLFLGIILAIALLLVFFIASAIGLLIN